MTCIVGVRVEFVEGEGAGEFFGVARSPGVGYRTPAGARTADGAQVGSGVADGHDAGDD